ncbi:MAG: hypothetical protein A3F54_04660 [Candidatus Kerfeldbacteria bacterium RIFCSPHIGHO2_12_FULL_48_17]|uniref:ATPase AAA-type core domain-containing protein n=1 Tax=Candidatus Kerfeldbacteria bacterium RIFCSPHIGHO2_12_FULL_48_17 TaxID=1798542 RepID=A0A1G2B2K5_9BACT|nr:MAG: hypothetical protein A3F54_04660 [Candidatus Kerfeldbacteria bacterium RIFCSPHIGHO2_12_FULL_48_17]
MKKIIILYGPPGVGKLTVAKALASRTKFTLLHLHLVADLVQSLFDYGTKPFSTTFKHIWFYLFEQGLKNTRHGLILTLVYGVLTAEGKHDAAFIKKIIATAKKHGTAVHFIKLECSDTELYRRVRQPSRKKFKKLTSPALLKKIRKNYKIDANIPFIRSLSINTSKKTATETATIIVTKIQ